MQELLVLRFDAGREVQVGTQPRQRLATQHGPFVVGQIGGGERGDASGDIPATGLPVVAHFRVCGEGVGEVARSVGYESESAFSTAYKRVMGGAPRYHSRLAAVA